MEIFDLFFWIVGRWIQKIFYFFSKKELNLSDGGSVTLGFFVTLLVVFIAFFTWGFFDV